MAKKVSVNQLVERVWDIDGYPNYFFGHDKRLYRFDSRGQVRMNKRIIIGTTQGYVLKSKFFSLEQLRVRLLRHRPQKLPSTDHLMDF
ncbi:hypothetical protein SAMN06269250_5868 [Spirosoma fluviale]|uniref:NUMOD4 motif-containing protein n=1 Tax=Spirosoma fluviale TaxID=1597977 RepID=A0A286GQ47_9BACT|nr:hypothetical protein SAMN06269250_5868 [Spirosoma fluviale]